jgi:hypothetical protein
MATPKAVRYTSQAPGTGHYPSSSRWRSLNPKVLQIFERNVAWTLPRVKNFAGYRLLLPDVHGRAVYPGEWVPNF